MNIQELAEQHLDALMEHALSAHRAHIEMIERAIAGDQIARAVFQEMATAISQRLGDGEMQ